MAKSTIYLELHLLEEALSGELSISDEVAGGSTDSFDGALNINILVGIFGVNSVSSVFNGGNGGGGSCRLVRGANKGGEGGNNTSGGRCGRKVNIHDHIGEEITKLRNGELNRGAKDGRASVSLGFIVFITDSGTLLIHRRLLKAGRLIDSGRYHAFIL